MKVEWDFTGQAFFDQLAASDQTRVMNDVKRLAKNWNSLRSSKVQLLRSRNAEVLYALRVGEDIRVLFVLREDVLVVVDIVRSSQIERLLGRRS